MICAFTGNLGTGKTYCLVYRALQEVKHGRRVFANMAVSWAEQFRSWDQLMDLGNGLVLIDEAAGWFGAREWKDSPKEVFQWMRQSRKNGLSLWYTTQHLSLVDKNLRIVTNLEYRHERWWGNWVRERAHDTGTGDVLSSRWIRIRKSIYEQYDTNEIVGDGKGSSNGRGFAGCRNLVDGPSRLDADRDAWTVAQASRSLVREGWGGHVIYRQATVWDVLNGADLVAKVGADAS